MLFRLTIATTIGNRGDEKVKYYHLTLTPLSDPSMPNVGGNYILHSARTQRNSASPFTESTFRSVGRKLSFVRVCTVRRAVCELESPESFLLDQWLATGVAMTLGRQSSGSPFLSVGFFLGLIVIQNEVYIEANEYILESEQILCARGNLPGNSVPAHEI